MSGYTEFIKKDSLSDNTNSIKLQTSSVQTIECLACKSALWDKEPQYENAVRILDELRITNAKHRQTILASTAHIAEVNRYSHDLKTGKVQANKNPGGLLGVLLPKGRFYTLSPLSKKVARRLLPTLSVPLRVVEEVAAPIIETPFLTWAVAGSFSGQNVHNSRTPLFPCRPMTGFPSLRRALNLVGSALLVALRAANWCFFSQLP